ncbi:hypothetical protein PMI42_02306 [Bradyrhizobium sp. YR681]|uniref:hypothetical protein n=1 Tax=Bradyrhizobium sp. YR681 TaxID=1144344 RepID=UPI0002712A6A|nr:hypothetical protein [Bradyrhizobium sp. YR681]EJN14136.1 hypothetical protein PMI42_02306 [Bradyrhizobium sp. YR681]
MKLAVVLRAIAIVVAQSLVAGTLFTAPLQTAFAQAMDMEPFLTFYKDPRPERLNGFFERYAAAATDWNAFPPTVGFYAVVFRKYPDWIERLIPARLNARSADTVDVALKFAGNEDARKKLKPRLDEVGHDPSLQVELADLPSQLADIRVMRPTHLDICWGAFFASGDERYVRMIIEFMAQTANRSEPVAIDIVAIVLAITGGPREILGQLKPKYGDEPAREMVFAATAAWALADNSRNHEKVARAMDTYVSGHPGTPASKLLSVLLRRPAGAPKR